MNKQQKYKPADKMAGLISNNYTLLQVISRFGLSLGFGDKTVREVCEMNQVDCHTFLAVVNFVEEGFSRMDDAESLSVPSLVDYLRQTHSYFLDFALPVIRRKLTESIDCDEGDEVAFLILRFFDEYVGEVKRHMDYEEKTVFKYVDDLLHNHPPGNYQISIFSKHHDLISEKLTELKQIIIKYCPQEANKNLLNAALFDIYICEEGLESHCKIEDFLLVPAILKLERRANGNEE